MIPDEDLDRHAVENLEQADALLFGLGAIGLPEAQARRASTPVTTEEQRWQSRS